jgi:hypothetical protein
MAGAVIAVARDGPMEEVGGTAHLGDNMDIPMPRGVPVGVDPKSDKPAGVGGIEAQLSGANLEALTLLCITIGWLRPLGLSGMDIIEFVDTHFSGSGFVLGRALPTLTGADRGASSSRAASANDSFNEKFEAHFAGADANGDGIGETDDGIISINVFFTNVPPPGRIPSTCVSTIFARMHELSGENKCPALAQRVRAVATRG